VRKKEGSERIRRWKRRLLWGAVLAPIVAWGAANLLLATSFGTGIIADRIGKRLSLPCEIERIGWTPWSGVVVRGVTLSAPDDFMQEAKVAYIEAIDLDLSWGDLLKKQVKLEALEMDGVDVNVPYELLRHLGRKRTTHVVLLDEPASDSDEAPAEVESADLPEEKKDPASEVVPDPEQDIPKQDAVVEAAEPEKGGTRVVLKRCSARVYSIMNPKREVTISDVAANFMIGGKADDGELTVAEVAVGGGGVMESVSVPLVWSGRDLSLPRTTFDLRGTEFSVEGVMRSGVGLPYAVRVVVPAQKLDLGQLTQVDLPVSVGQMEGAHRLDGFALRPTQVYGSSRTTFKDIVVRDPGDQTPVVFDWGHAVFRLNPAGLTVPDFRWVGEEDAVLGNGYLTVGGQGTVVVRLVGSAERAAVYQRRVAEWREGFSLEMQPLETPDRWYSDVRFDLAGGGVTMGLEREEERSFIP